MQVLINGEQAEIAEEISISALLASLGIDPEQVAVEMDRNVVPRATWGETRVGQGAAIEIVRFVGGG